jgi:ceramide glucosyltransferase
MNAISLILFFVATFGSVALTLQLFLVIRHLRERHPPRAPQGSAPPPGISILKPLCGVDDGLEDNLASFARLDYPRYEVVLGVKNAEDPAYPVAKAAVARWPGLMRLELQRGEPGLNPKVNQLITLAAAARYEVLLVSDSNVRVGPDYLWSVARGFEDPQVACVTSPVSGMGEQTLGSLMDNLYLCTSAGAGQIAAKRLAGKDIVVGKSMALRRSDLEAMGGFEAAKDLLAEDFCTGVWIRERLRKRVVVALQPVFNVSQRKSLKAFFKRYVRWTIIHRSCISLPTYVGQATLNPLPWAAMGALLALGALVTWKVAVELATFHAMRLGERTPWMKAVPALLLKDVLLFAAWVNALVNRTVDWRGHKLRVLPGSWLQPPPSYQPTPLPDSEPREPEELVAS